MFEAIKKLFTKTIQLTSEFFDQSRVVQTSDENKDVNFISAEIIEEPKQKIKKLKWLRKSF